MDPCRAKACERVLEGRGDGRVEVVQGDVGGHGEAQAAR